MKTRLAVHGACGRMGQRLVALAREDADLEVVAAIDSPGHPRLGEDAGTLAGGPLLGVPVWADLAIGARVDCVIDFSVPSATLGLLQTCVDRVIPLVVATTGFEPAERDEILAAAHHTAVLLSPSMSLVVNLLFKLTKLTGETLAGKGFDVEIVERQAAASREIDSSKCWLIGETVLSLYSSPKCCRRCATLCGVIAR